MRTVAAFGSGDTRGRVGSRPNCRADLIIDVRAMKAWGSNGLGQPHSRTQCSPWGTTSATTSVDHSPSYLWNSATWEISKALMPFLATVISGQEGWDANLTIRRAVEISRGRRTEPQDPLLPIPFTQLPAPDNRTIHSDTSLNSRRDKAVSQSYRSG